MIESVAAILVKDEKILIVQKDPHHKLAGLWEFPGGKVEGDESLEVCLAREMIEELSIDIKVLEPIMTYTFPLEQMMLKINAYYVLPLSGEIILTEHVDMVWVNPCQLADYPFVPSDEPIVKQLMSKKNNHI